MQFMLGDFIDLTADQSYFDSFHISFIVYDLDEEELLLTSTKEIDFKIEHNNKNEAFCWTIKTKTIKITLVIS